MHWSSRHCKESLWRLSMNISLRDKPHLIAQPITFLNWSSMHSAVELVHLPCRRNSTLEPSNPSTQSTSLMMPICRSGYLHGTQQQLLSFVALILQSMILQLQLWPTPRTNMTNGRLHSLPHLQLPTLQSSRASSALVLAQDHHERTISASSALTVLLVGSLRFIRGSPLHYY
jgi:hypothetical protein